MTDLLGRASEAAKQLGHLRVGDEHLVLALVDSADMSAGSRALRQLGITKASYADAIEQLPEDHNARTTSSGRIEFSRPLTDVLARAHGLALGLGDGVTRSEHVLQALLWVERPAPLPIRLLETHFSVTRQQIADTLAGQGAPMPTRPLPRDVFYREHRLVEPDEVKALRTVMDREGILYGAIRQGDRILILAERWPESG